MQNYLVLGLGRSGIAVSNFLMKNGNHVYVYDNSKKLAKELKDGNILSKECEIVNKLCVKTLSIVHCIIISPGIKLEKKIEKIVKEKNIQVIGEMAFASKFCPAEIYAITGTNGKTTTVQLLAHIFKTAKLNTHTVGNIGNAFSGEVDKIAPSDKVVCEVSSFQLEYSQDFAPKAIGFLNIAPDHLDRYKDFDEYFNAKKIILDRVKDRIFLNYDDEKVRELGQNKNNVEYFSVNELPTNVDGLFIRENKVFKRYKEKEDFILNLDKIKLIGKHNLSNILCAICFALYDGISNDVIQKGVNSFKSPKHRIEFVGEINGVKYYNDSKATNTSACLTAVKSFEKENICLMLGGSNKGESFNALIKNLPSNVNHIIAFGKMGKKIFKTAKKLNFNNISLTKSLYDAIILAKELAKPKDIVLLSPACASFDEFRNYEQRGEFFSKTVLE